MNIYDKKQIKCSVCGQFLGEMDDGSVVIYPLCFKCNKKEKYSYRKGISKILVPIDNTKKSFRALDAAIYIAKHTGSSLMVLYVVPIPYQTRMLLKQIVQENEDIAQKSIEKIRNHAAKKQFTIQHKIIQGNEPDQIINVAKKLHFDLIVMGSSGKGALKELLFGSISNYVMHNTDIPVLLIKENSVTLDTKISKIISDTKTKKK